MNQTSLFEIMQDYSPSVVDRTRPQEPTVQDMTLSVILTSDCYAFFSFKEHLKNHCNTYHFSGHQSVMPLSRVLHETLKDHWRACKGMPNTRVFWEDKYRDNAQRNAKAYVIAIDKLLESKNAKIRYNEKVQEFLKDAKIRFERIQTALTTP